VHLMVKVGSEERYVIIKNDYAFAVHMVENPEDISGRC